MKQSFFPLHQRNAALDGLRGIAVLAVLAFHSMHGPERLSFLLGGYFGVELFFVLSGYIITALLLREEKRVGRISLKHFYIRRALRLLPPLFVFLLVCFIESRAWESEAIHAAVSRGTVSTLLYYSNWLLASEPASLDMLNHTWSLSIEEQFYLSFPFLVYFFVNRKTPMMQRAGVLCGLALLSVLAGVILVFRVRSVNQLVPRTDVCANQILWGCAAAMLVHSDEERAARILKICRALFIPAAAMLVLTFWYCGVTYRNEHWIRYLLVTQGFALSSAVLIIVLAFSALPWATKVFSNPPLVFLGTISYALYLWHIPVFFYFDRHHPEWTWQLRAAAGWTTAIFAAALSWHLIEAPLARYRKKFHDDAPDEQPLAKTVLRKVGGERN